MIVIHCASCGNASQIDPSLVGQVIQCPQCGQPTPAAPAPPPPPPVNPPPVKQSPPAPKIKVAPNVKKRDEEGNAKAPAEAVPKPTPEPKQKRVLTRAERLAIRRRWHLFLAVGGGVLLAIIASVLASRG